MRMTSLETPIGTVRIVAERGAVTGLYLPLQPEVEARVAVDDPVLGLAADELREYFAGSRWTFTVPVTPHGTGFQQAVWSALRRIPAGETRAYGEMARSLGAPRSARAVGAAIALNPISIIVPCHRLVGAGGELRGHAGGLTAKGWLLQHERGGALDSPASPVEAAAAPWEG